MEADNDWYQRQSFYSLEGSGGLHQLCAEVTASMTGTHVIFLQQIFLIIVLYRWSEDM